MPDRTLGLGRRPALPDSEFRAAAIIVLAAMDDAFTPTPVIAMRAGMPIGRVSRILSAFGSRGPVERKYQLRPNSQSQFLTMWRKIPVNA